MKKKLPFLSLIEENDYKQIYKKYLTGYSDAEKYLVKKILTDKNITEEEIKAIYENNPTNQTILLALAKCEKTPDEVITNMMAKAKIIDVSKAIICRQNMSDGLANFCIFVMASSIILSTAPTTMKDGETRVNEKLIDHYANVTKMKLQTKKELKSGDEIAIVYCRNSKILNEIAQIEQLPENISALLINHKYIDDNTRDRLFENGCDFESIYRYTPHMKETIYKSAMETIDCENSSILITPEIGKEIPKCVNAIKKLFIDRDIPSSIVHDLMARMQYSMRNTDEESIICGFLERGATNDILLKCLEDDKIDERHKITIITRFEEIKGADWYANKFLRGRTEKQKKCNPYMVMGLVRKYIIDEQNLIKIIKLRNGDKSNQNLKSLEECIPKYNRASTEILKTLSQETSFAETKFLIALRLLCQEQNTNAPFDIIMSRDNDELTQAQFDITHKLLNQLRKTNAEHFSTEIDKFEQEIYKKEIQINNVKHKELEEALEFQASIVSEISNCNNMLEFYLKVDEWTEKYKKYADYYKPLITELDLSAR